MAFTEIYVDPSIAADSGAGTIGDPYGDLEYAVKQETFDTTNGTRVNIKAGTDEILAADLGAAIADTSVSVAWAPSASAPLIFQGYTSAAGDGGIGGISGGGSVAIIDAQVTDYINFIDLRLHNTGAAEIAHIDDFCSFINCEIYNSTSNAINADNNLTVFDCYIHNVGAAGVIFRSGLVSTSFFENGTNSFNTAITTTVSGIIERNIVSVSGASNGIVVGNGYAINNSVYSSGGTGIGIDISGTAPTYMVMNNLVSGFSGAGGVGIDQSDSTMRTITYGANSIHDCETAVSGSSIPIAKTYVADETLSASPFSAPATGDFSPVDTGAVKEGSYPQTFNEG